MVHWRARKWAVTFWLYCVSLALGACSFLEAETGRGRIQAMLAALVVWGSSFLWTRWGQDLPFFASSSAAIDQDDDDDDDDPSTSEASSAPVTPRPSQEDAVLKDILSGQQALAERMTRMESSPQSMPSPPARVEVGDLGATEVSPQVAALADFVNGFQPPGALSAPRRILTDSSSHARGSRAVCERGRAASAVASRRSSSTSKLATAFPSVASRGARVVSLQRRLSSFRPG